VGARVGQPPGPATLEVRSRHGAERPSRNNPEVHAGTVIALNRWPVKSMAGEPVRALRVDGRGAGGDRTHALFDEFKGAPRRLTAREAPRMLAWSAGYPDTPADDLDPDDPPLPVLTAPDGARLRWDDMTLPGALAADLGRAVSLRRDVSGHQDRPRTVLVTTEATRCAVEQALGAPLDLRRFRTNIHLDLDAPAFAEERWEGRRLTVGDAEIELLDPCERCVIPTRDPDTQERWADLLRWLTREHRGLFGINARPLNAARIRVGDRAVVA
jgi:uncharacterized protein